MTILLHTELSTSPTEPGSSFRVCFTVYSPDGSLPKGKISSGEHVLCFAIENVLPSGTQESGLRRENKRRLCGDFTGAAESRQAPSSLCPVLAMASVSCPVPTAAIARALVVLGEQIHTHHCLVWAQRYTHSYQ